MTEEKERLLMLIISLVEKIKENVVDIDIFDDKIVVKTQTGKNTDFIELPMTKEFLERYSFIELIAFKQGTNSSTANSELFPLTVLSYSLVLILNLPKVSSAKNLVGVQLSPSFSVSISTPVNVSTWFKSPNLTETTTGLFSVSSFTISCTDDFSLK